MRYLAVILSVCLFVGIDLFQGQDIVSAADLVQVPQELTEQSVYLEQGQRYYLEYIPDDVSSMPPLVILLHGGTRSMRLLFSRGRTTALRWVELARHEGFVLVIPNGVNPKTGDAYGDEQSWNDLRPSIGPGMSQADDVDFILRLIDIMVERVGVDPDRIYVTGASNGGMMCFRLLVEHPEAFAAAATFIANLPEESVSTPQQAVPLFMAFGTDDPMVPYEGGNVIGRQGRVRSAEQTMDFWLQASGLEAAPRRTMELPDLDAEDHCRMVRTSYLDPQGREMLVFISIQGGGHYTPSSSAPQRRVLARAVFGRQCRDAEGADLAWEFFKQFRR